MLERLDSTQPKTWEISGFNIQELVSEEQIQKRLTSLADQIYKDYYKQGKNPVFICVLKGAEPTYIALTQELGRENQKTAREPVSTQGGHIGLSSYGKGEVSSGKHKVTIPLSVDIAGRDVIVVEDIVDSGQTIAELDMILRKDNPNSIEYFALLDKKEGRKVIVNVKYRAFEIPNKFVVGYGLDFNETELRNLPFVGYLEQAS